MCVYACEAVPGGAYWGASNCGNARTRAKHISLTNRLAVSCMHRAKVYMFAYMQKYLYLHIVLAHKQLQQRSLGVIGGLQGTSGNRRSVYIIQPI